LRKKAGINTHFRWAIQGEENFKTGVGPPSGARIRGPPRKGGRARWKRWAFRGPVKKRGSYEIEGVLGVAGDGGAERNTRKKGFGRRGGVETAMGRGARARARGGRRDKGEEGPGDGREWKKNVFIGR